MARERTAAKAAALKALDAMDAQDDEMQVADAAQHYKLFINVTMVG